jgi:hypothetical protein
MKLTDRLTRSLLERRRLRGRNALHIAIADRFSQLNVESWRSVTRGRSFFYSAEYQQAFERCRPTNIEPRFALISDGDTPLAIVCMQIVQIDMRQVGKLSMQSNVDALRGRIQQRVLVCGNLLVYGMHGVCCADAADRSKVWPAVAEVLYRVRRAEKIAGHTDLILIKDLDESAVQESGVLSKLSYGAVPTEPNMVLTLEPAWKSHDDYLKSLSSKYRSDIKNRIFKKFDEAGCVVEPLQDVAAESAHLQRLYEQVHGNAQLRPFLLTERYWTSLAEAGGDNVAFHVARQGGKLIGFVVSLKDRDTAFAYHIGFDREVAEGGVPVYLRLLHAALSQAIAFGCRRVSFGRTALEPKARMGCKPDPTFVWARHRHPLLNQMIQPLLKLIDPDDAPEFTPFKAAADAKT